MPVKARSEIGRGLDILEFTPSPLLSQNEIDAAKTVRLEYLNAQGQPKFTWPASFSLSKAYVDQLERDNGMQSSRVAAVREALQRAEGLGLSERRAALNALAGELDRDAQTARDGAKVRTLAASLRNLAARQ